LTKISEKRLDVAGRGRTAVRPYEMSVMRNFSDKHETILAPGVLFAANSSAKT